MDSPADLEGRPPARIGTPSLSTRLRHARRRFFRRLVRVLGPIFLGTLARTWRLTILGADNLASDAKGHFIALWHGRMLLGLAHHGSRNWWVLVSASQDGDISRALLEGFGYRVVRGSTGRRGAEAVREMMTIMDEGGVVIITPDGPRGPKHSITPGLAWMARTTGYPIVPIGFACDRAWRLRSWDRFMIPKPWARVVMVYGEPIHVEDGKDEDRLESANGSVRAALLEAETRAFGQLGEERDW